MNNLRIRFKETEKDGKLVYVSYNHGEWLVIKWDDLDEATRLVYTVLSQDKDCEFNVQGDIPWRK